MEQIWRDQGVSTGINNNKATRCRNLCYCFTSYVCLWSVWSRVLFLLLILRELCSWLSRSVCKPFWMSTICVSWSEYYTLVLIGMEQEVRLRRVEETPIMSMLSCAAKPKVYRISIQKKYLYWVYLWNSAMGASLQFQYRNLPALLIQES
jgi:hypothetical protein